MDMSNYIENIEINLDKIRSNYDLIRRGVWLHFTQKPIRRS